MSAVCMSCGYPAPRCTCRRVAVPVVTLADELLVHEGDEAAERRLSVRYRVFVAIVVVVALLLVVALLQRYELLAAAAAPAQRLPLTPTRHARQIPYGVLAAVVDVAAVLARPLWWLTDRLDDKPRKARRPGRVRGWVAGYGRWLAEDHPVVSAVVWTVLVVVLVVCTAASS